MYGLQERRRHMCLSRAGSRASCVEMWEIKECTSDCVFVLIYVCHQGGGTRFSGRTSSSMLVFVRGFWAKMGEEMMVKWRQRGDGRVTPKPGAARMRV